VTDETPPEHRLTIRLDIRNLPADDPPAQYAERLTSQLARALGEAGRPVSHAASWVGPTYTSVRADCPNCDEYLKIHRPHLDTENGALAHARCPDESCGWTGDAEYRLIDVVEHDGSDQPRSLVAEGRLTPNTQEYR
jgi:hypothetical protein